MDLLKIVFTFVLLLLPLGEIIRIHLGNTVIVKPLDIGVGLVVILWLISKLRKRKAIKQKYIAIPVLFFIGIGSLSLLINSSYLSFNQFFVSSMYLIRWIVYAGTFFVVNDFDRDFKKRIVSWLIIVGTLIVGLGYLQYFFYSNLKGFLYLGWDEHMHRMFSTFLDPNFAGAFFVLFFLFALSRFFQSFSIFHGGVSFLTLGAVFLTFSRGAILMLIMTLIIFLTMLNMKKWIFLLFIITIIVFVISSKHFYIENINLLRTVSTKARLETSFNAIQIIKDYPILGIGFNAYKYAQVKYGFRLEGNAAKSHADAGVDNSFLFVFATTGIVGLIAYLFLWYRILKKYWFSALVVSSILGIFLNSLFLNSLFYPSIMMWIWVLLGTMGYKEGDPSLRSG